ncbi:MAG: hypothetical protein AB1894_23075 [Chloroflexota bacterium]
MHNFSRILYFSVVLLVAVSFSLAACGPGQLLGPTLTPTATNTPEPTSTPTPPPGIGVTQASMLLAFEVLGFQFTDGNGQIDGQPYKQGINGGYTMILAGPQENLAGASIHIPMVGDMSFMIAYFISNAMPDQAEAASAWISAQVLSKLQEGEYSSRFGAVKLDVSIQGNGFMVLKVTPAP